MEFKTCLVNISERKAFHGLALVILKSTESIGNIELTAMSNGLEQSEVTVKTKN